MLTEVLKAPRVRLQPGMFVVPALAALAPEPLAAAPLLPPAAPSLSHAEVESLLAEARAEASRALRAAGQQAHEMRQAAQEEGLAQGFEAGRAEGHAQGLTLGQEQARPALESAARLLEETRRWREDLLARSESTVLDMVGEVARKLFGDGFSLAPEQLRGVVERAQERARHLGEARIRLHPDDLALLQPLWSSAVPLVPDETLQRGGCVVEAARGSVDGRIETQLEQIDCTLSEGPAAEL